MLGGCAGGTGAGADLGVQQGPGGLWQDGQVGHTRAVPSALWPPAQPSLATSPALGHCAADNGADTDVRPRRAAALSPRQDKLFGLWTRLFLFRTGLLSLN